MIVEHEIVTTKEENAARAVAAAFLQAGGFVGESSAGAADQAPRTMLDMRRGKKNAARARSVSELPQRLILHYDRGRITIAASIVANHIWGGRSGLHIGLGLSNVAESPQKMELHQKLLLGIVQGLEKLLVENQYPESARAAWLDAEAEILHAARRRKRRTLIGAMVILLLVAVIAFVIYLAAK